MNEIHEYYGWYTLNVQPGEDIVETLTAFAERKGVEAAHITGLGAASAVEVAHYNLDTKEYERTTVDEALEICSLTGNIGIREGGVKVVHLHGVFARRDLSTFGGHVCRCIVSGAGELHVHALPGSLHRSHDTTTGLTLLGRVDS